MILPKHVAKNAPKGRLLSESEWRGLGVQQSRGWVHYAIHRFVRHAAPWPLAGVPPCNHACPALRPRPYLTCSATWRDRRPEPHILLFRRPQGTDPTTGLVHGKRIDPATGKVVG